MPSQGTRIRAPARAAIRAEVELVIAEHRHLNAEPLVSSIICAPFGEARQHRGRDEVAAEGGDALCGGIARSA